MGLYFYELDNLRNLTPGFVNNKYLNRNDTTPEEILAQINNNSQGHTDLYYYIQQLKKTIEELTLNILNLEAELLEMKLKLHNDREAKNS